MIPSVAPLTSRPGAIAQPPGADGPVAGHHAATRGEHERHREVGGGGVEHAGRVRDGDAAGRRGRDVDAVVADAVVRDQAQRRVQLEVDGLVDHDERVHVRAGNVGRRDLDLAELVPCRARQVMGRSDLHLGHATTLSP